MKQSAFIAALKFVAHAKAKNDVRYYLNSVKLEFHAGHLTIIATDGHRMAWAGVAAPDMPDAEYLLDGAGVDAVLKAFKVNSTGSIAFDFGEHRVTLESADGMAVAKYVDGKFPDWKRVSTLADGNPAIVKGVNCDYLADAGKAFKGLAKKWGRVVLTVGPENSAMRLSCDDPSVVGVGYAYCIIMSMRD